MTVNDLQRCDARGIRNYVPTVWPRMITFGKATSCGRRHITTCVSHASISGAGPQSPPIFGIHSVLPRPTTFAIVTCGACFNRVRHYLCPKGVGLQHAKFWHLTCAHHMVRRTATKFCTEIKLDDRKIFTRSTAPTCQKNFVTQMLTRDLFATLREILRNY